MLNKLNNNFNLHSTPNEFTTTIEYTSNVTEFQPELIEKDYYCSAILNYIYSSPFCPLIFKGGTLLTKVHAGFYRLSEDLDFSLPVSPFSTRKQRSDLIKPLKKIISSLPNNIENIKLDNELTGINESRQYNAAIKYPSVLSKTENRILIEISLRENLLLPAIEAQSQTSLLDPFTGKIKIPSFSIRCLQKTEAYAEKIRAALTREKLAIRDYFDIAYAIKHKHIVLEDKELMHFAKQKMKESNASIRKFNSETFSILEKKIITELLPTLRKQDAADFDLKQTVNFLLDLVNNNN